MILIFLQNPWLKPGVSYKNRKTWLDGLWSSHTGRRLLEMLPDNCDYYIENSNKRIAKTSDGRYPPDISHMSRTIKRTNPKIILACGKISQEGLDTLNVPYIAAPHPAWRQLSKKQTAKIKRVLENVENL